MNKLQTLRGQRGFTLLELLLVIGVGALLLIGGIATYRLVSDGNKATEAARLLLTIRQEASVMAQQQGGNYAGIAFTSNPATPNSPLVFAGILRSGQRNPFNGDVNITPSGTGNVNLTVEFTNVSQSACLKMLQAVNNPNEVVSIAVNGGTAFTSAAATIPVTIANATGANGCDLPLNAITWIFP